MPPIAIHVTVSVGTSVTLVYPAKAVERNEMPFDRDTCVVPSNIVLDRDPGPPMERRDAAYRQVTLTLVEVTLV